MKKGTVADMDLTQILEEVDSLSLDERNQLQRYLVERNRSRPQHSVEEWMAELEDIAREFRGDSTDEEMVAIFETISLKSKPS